MSEPAGKSKRTTFWPEISELRERITREQLTAPLHDLIDALAARGLLDGAMLEAIVSAFSGAPRAGQEDARYRCLHELGERYSR